jgi:4'-phosphopantetheinyl transferase EntD
MLSAARTSLREQLECDLHILAARAPVARAGLSAGEAARVGGFARAARRREWRRGRAALKAALARLGRDTDTSLLALPDPEVSLTHAGGLALAVALCGGQGVGVDYDSRAPRPRTWHLVFTPRERAVAATGARAALRLWTLKEALFKADAGNDRRWLGDYALEDPAAERGRAFVAGDPGACFGYATAPLGAGLLSVAIRARGAA